ncbi:unnamed protein product [Prorocentrum cordatum]|uniref:Uncharacterized protein n=1 Tax=Prorocentrum cordatum TaxID=2364126 RepID=A0ABN9SVN5_9DINO|nr:unnamed protein product [Polarella glacialis]
MLPYRRGLIDIEGVGEGFAPEASSLEPAADERGACRQRSRPPPQSLPTAEPAGSGACRQRSRPPLRSLPAAEPPAATECPPEFPSDLKGGGACAPPAAPKEMGAAAPGAALGAGAAAVAAAATPAAGPPGRLPPPARESTESVAAAAPAIASETTKTSETQKSLDPSQPARNMAYILVLAEVRQWQAEGESVPAIASRLEAEAQRCQALGAERRCRDTTRLGVAYAMARQAMGARGLV